MQPAPGTTRRSLQFVLLLGLVSLLADATYEGARSVTGPYLALLGAGAAAVGAVAGFGELAGYALRLASGWLADRTRKYWAITITGYALNLAAVPLLALARRWEAVAALIVAERAGKALRTPSRDAMLSHAAANLGRGWAFGLHEALDQMGAVAGPLLVAWILAARGSYAWAFACLAVPAALALGALLGARALYPRPRDLEVQALELDSRRLPSVFWVYVGGAALLGAGYADFALLAYHFDRTGAVAGSAIALLYAAAMGVDGIAALLLGRLYDRQGTVLLVASCLMAAPFAPLAFLGGRAAALVGTGLWAVGMGAQESVLRAAIGDMAPAHRRAAAYGVFHAVFGLSWFAGSAVMGALYGVSRAAPAAFSVLTLTGAALLFALADRGARGARIRP